MNLKQIEVLGFYALEKAYKKQCKLSRDGTIGIRVSKGDGGDTSLRGDIESENEVIEILKRYNFPAIIYAEEHGIIQLSDNPRYLVVIDGFDGSSALAKNDNARGGTMLAIATNLNPQYEDFIFGGITDFSTNRIICAVKDKGAVVVNEKLEATKLEKFQLKQFNSKLRVHLDDPKYVGNYEEGITAQLDKIAEVVRKNFTLKLEGKVKCSGLMSSGAMCMDLITGVVDAVCGVSAKGVFEQPSEYSL